MHIRSVGRFKVRETKDALSVRQLVNRGLACAFVRDIVKIPR